MQRELGVDFLGEDGRPMPGLGPVKVEHLAHDALTRDEPRIELDAVTAHFDGDVLTDIRVGYRDRDDDSQHEVNVSYQD